MNDAEDVAVSQSFVCTGPRVCLELQIHLLCVSIKTGGSDVVSVEFIRTLLH